MKYLFTYILFFGSIFFVTPFEATGQINYFELAQGSLLPLESHADIHLSRVFPAHDELAMPVINLHGDEQLIFSFDEFTNLPSNYQYTYVHCSSDWIPSDMNQTEYIEGYYEYDITTYQHSFNTRMDFVHYTVKIPNENIQIKLPGNYAIIVFENYEPSKPVIVQRFFVVDNRTSIQATIESPSGSNYSTHQSVEFNVDLQNHPVFDPMRDIETCIYQNMRWDKVIYDLTAEYQQGNKLIFNNQEKNSFSGNQEFAHIDIKDYKYTPLNVRKIEYINPYYHVWLKPDEINPYSAYQIGKDLNGRYIVKNDQGVTMGTDADYFYVHFSLNYDVRLPDGEFYVVGAFNNWQYTDENKMFYDYRDKKYHLKYTLKQGYYNYLYEYVAQDKNAPQHIQPGFTETENDYMIFVYEKDFDLSYDKLIGFAVFNSVEN